MWNRLTVTEGWGEGDNGGKKGKKTSQSICMNDPWTWTTVWGLIMEVEGGLGGGGQR